MEEEAGDTRGASSRKTVRIHGCPETGCVGIPSSDPEGRSLLEAFFPTLGSTVSPSYNTWNLIEDCLSRAFQAHVEQRCGVEGEEGSPPPTSPQVEAEPGQE